MEYITVPYHEADAIERLTNGLIRHLYKHARHREIVILCIGTDRSTGDALGPLIGSRLCQSQDLPIFVYGNLDEPVHALNLAETIEMITNKHVAPYTIAVDACLGRLKNVGNITVKDGPLRPGSGVNKELPEVGDLQITGNVNVGGFMEFFVLQNTRLSLVMKMAEVISMSICQALQENKMLQHRSYNKNMYSEAVSTLHSRILHIPVFKDD